MACRNADTIEIDQFVGKRITALRHAKGIKRHQLAGVLKISQQQLHKHEIGVNRVSVGRLIFIAKALGENVSYFYSGVEKEAAVDEIECDPMYLEVSRNFVKIKNREYQKCVAALVKVLAENGLERTA